MAYHVNQCSLQLIIKVVVFKRHFLLNLRGHDMTSTTNMGTTCQTYGNMIVRNNKKMLHLLSCSLHWEHRHLILEHMSTIIDCWVNGGGKCMTNIGTMELVINTGKSDTPGRNDKNYQLPMTGWGWVWCLWVWCYEFSHTNPSNFQQLLQSLLLRYMAENLQVINLILICSLSSL